jgi:hypothetical protein
MSLEALAFALLIGGQFLAAIASISKRAQLYPDSGRPNVDQDRLQPTEPTRFAAHNGAISALTRVCDAPLKMRGRRVVADMVRSPLIACRRFAAVPPFTP